MTHVADIDLKAGQILNNGRYRIERELNRGGTAAVYAAQDTHTLGYVALKVMRGPEHVPVQVDGRMSDSEKDSPWPSCHQISSGRIKAHQAPYTKTSAVQ